MHHAAQRIKALSIVQVEMRASDAAIIDLQ